VSIKTDARKFESRMTSVFRSVAEPGLTASLMAFFLFISACSYGPAPPTLIPAPMAPAIQKLGGSGSLTTVYVLPTQLPNDMTDVGTLFKMNGEYSELITEKPLGPSLDAILLDRLKSSGLAAIPTKDPSHKVTLQIFMASFQDKIKEKLLNTEQSGKIRMNAVLILHSESTTRTLTRSIERHRSPRSTVSFDRKDPSELLGGLFSDAIVKDLVPYLKQHLGEAP